MAKTPFQAKQLAQLPAKNHIINSGFDFWQRGTSFTAQTPWTADRWGWNRDASHTTTISRSTDVPTLIQSKFSSTYSLLATNGTGSATASNGFAQLRYFVEGYDYAELHGRKVRLQFWVKSSVPGQYSIGLNNNAGTRSMAVGYVIDAANTWEKKIIDLTLDTEGIWLFDNQIGVRLLFELSIGSTLAVAPSLAGIWQNGNGALGLTTNVDWQATTGATFRIAQVQLLPADLEGSAADITFYKAGKTIQDELAMCQRYYEKSYTVDTDPGTSGQFGGTSMNAGSTTSGIRHMTTRFSVSKRAGATITIYPTGNTITSGNVTTEDGTGSGGANVATAAINVGTGGFGISTTGATTSPGIRSQWTADAEL